MSWKVGAGALSCWFDFDVLCGRDLLFISFLVVVSGSARVEADAVQSELSRLDDPAV